MPDGSDENRPQEPETTEHDLPQPFPPVQPDYQGSPYSQGSPDYQGTPGSQGSPGSQGAYWYQPGPQGFQGQPSVHNPYGYQSQPGYGGQAYPQPGQPAYPQPEQQPPYPQPGQAPYPQAGQAPYPQAGQPPYPQAGQPPYPQAGQPPYPQPGPAPYPQPEQQPPYPQAGQPPYVQGGQSPYGQPPYPQSGSYQGIPGYPADQTHVPPHRHATRKWLPWAVGGTAVIVVGGVIAGLLVSGGSGPGSGKSPGAASSPAGKASAGSTAGSTPVPRELDFAGTPSSVTGRVTDSAAALSWDKLGGPWGPIPSSLLKGGDFSAGQQVVTDKFKLNGHTSDWTASVLAGAPGPDVGVAYKGPGQLEQYATAVVENVVLEKDYPPGVTAAGLDSQSFRVSGRPGWLIGFAPRFKVKGVKATHDTDVVIAVATGTDPIPSVFFLSVPNDASRLMPDITVELRSLRVSG